jgi:predicted RNA-binding Zn-ribbon protein involved in translation (DUF1610 family)
MICLLLVWKNDLLSYFLRNADVPAVVDELTDITKYQDYLKDFQLVFAEEETETKKLEETELRCAFCGVEFSEDAIICPGCGKQILRCPVCLLPIVQGDESVKCPSCGFSPTEYT